MSDLLGALGQAWPRIALYPGGIAALIAMILLARLRGARRIAWPDIATLIDLLPPLSVICLLPLAPAAPFAYGLDLPVALTLLLWPELRRAASEQRDPRSLLEQWSALLLAGIALASAANTLNLSELLRWPGDAGRQIALLLSALAWLAASAVALPLRSDLPNAGSGLGLLLIGALPLIGAIGALPGLNAAPAPLIVALATLSAGMWWLGMNRAPVRATRLLTAVALGAVGLSSISAY